MAAPQTLAIARRGGVARVTMARAAVFNAFDEAMIAELDAAFAELADDTSVRAIVLAGEGRHFSGGADPQWMQRASPTSQAWNLDDARRFASMLARIDASPNDRPCARQRRGAGRLRRLPRQAPACMDARQRR